MKVASVLALATFALASCSVDRAAAGTCSPDDEKKLISLMAQIIADANCLDMSSTNCPNSKCLATVQKVVRDLPDCTANGETPKSVFEKALKECGVSSTVASSSSFAGVTTASTAVAVAAAAAVAFL